MKNLLKTRNALKAKKPEFVRQDSHKKKRISSNWRRPKGRHNKVRLHRRSYLRHVSTGFGSPAAVKGLSPEGYRKCLVTNKEELNALDPAKDAAIISGRIGDRKREELVSLASEKNVVLLNLDADSFKKKLSHKLKQKSEKRKRVLERRAKKKKSSKSKTSDTSSTEKSSSDSSASSGSQEQGSQEKSEASLEEKASSAQDDTQEVTQNSSQKKSTQKSARKSASQSEASAKKDDRKSSDDKKDEKNNAEDTAKSTPVGGGTK